MTTRISSIDHGSLISRGSIFGAAAALICAPAIVRVTNLMPVRISAWTSVCGIRRPPVSSLV
jgi:hypothetical protein